MEYEVWHDEYKGTSDVNEYWHVLLFIPTKSKPIIIEKLKAIRDQHKVKYDQEIKFAGCLQSPERGRFHHNQLQLLVHSLLVKDIYSTYLINYDGKKKYNKDFREYQTLTGIWGCKLILMKIPDNHTSMNKYPMTYPERVETTFRFAFKSGVHFLFNYPLTIKGFVFDGYEHHTRRLDKNRLIKGDFKEHVSLDLDLFIDDRHRPDRDIDSGLIMSLVDTAVGGFSASIEQKSDPHKFLYPLEGILSRAKKGTLNLNINGRWYKAASLFRMDVKNHEITFSDMFLAPEQGMLVF